MTPSYDLEPERPRSAGVEEGAPPRAYIEGARLLANDAFPRLAAQGFTRRQVRLWAEAYLSERSPGDVDDFVGWIAEQEGVEEVPKRSDNR